MQWLKKLLLHLRFTFIINYARRHAPPHKPNRRLCEDLLKELNPHYFKDYNPVSATGLIINTRYASIEDFTDKIKESRRLIQHERPVPSSWEPDVVFPVTLDRFLVSSDGYYLEPYAAVQRFRQEALKLCELMRDSDDATYGLPEHNLRMLTKLFIAIRETTTALVRCSLA